MVTLKIKNELVSNWSYMVIDPSRVSETTDESDRRLRVKHCDAEKWKDGRIYEFNTLREVLEFIKSCDVAFTEETEEEFGDWDWWELDLTHYIDPSEDNLIIFRISMHKEIRG